MALAQPQCRRHRDSEQGGTAEPETAVWLAGYSRRPKRVDGVKDRRTTANIFKPQHAWNNVRRAARYGPWHLMQAQSPHSKLAADSFCVGRQVFAIVIVLLLPAPAAIAGKLGGPYYVDDAEIGKVGSCEVESWGSFSDNGAHILVFSPACVANFGVPVELGTNAVNVRPEEIGNSTVSLTAKTVPLPIGRSGVGLALSGALVYDQVDRTINGAIFTVPITFDFSQQLRLNLNVGGQYNGDTKAFMATAGVGVAWNFIKQWSVISEVFALMGPGESNPRFQTGLRYSPAKDVDWDVIYGRNLTGEVANWVTVALTFRINDN
jgi:hypothetical protein